MVAFFTAIAALLCHLLLARFWLAVAISAACGLALSVALSFAAGHLGWGNDWLSGIILPFAFACIVSAVIGVVVRWLANRTRKSQGNRTNGL